MKMDENIKASLRKYKANMEIGGIALIVLGIWTVLKFVITMFLGEGRNINTVFPDGITTEEDRAYLTIFIVVAVIVLSVSTIFHGYLGTSAIRFARGKKKSKFFLLWAVVMFGLTFYSFPGYFRNIADETQNTDTTVASFFLDLILCFILIDIIFCAFKICKLSKESQ